jgi:hypothetical protein
VLAGHLSKAATSCSGKHCWLEEYSLFLRLSKGWDNDCNKSPRARCTDSSSSKGQPTATARVSQHGEGAAIAQIAYACTQNTISSENFARWPAAEKNPIFCEKRAFKSMEVPDGGGAPQAS